MSAGMFIDPMTTCDFYKVSHKSMYPEGTSLVYSNFTPRSDRLCPTVKSVDDNRIVFFGMQGFMKWFLQDVFGNNFFDQSKTVVLSRYKRRMGNALGPDSVDVSHIEALHDLGYLPLEVMALPEGSKVDPKVPVFTVHNTKPEFFWLVNYLETVFSNSVWKSMVTSTLAYRYRQTLEKFAEMTGTPKEVVGIQGHDFSCRGMSGPYDAAMSGAGHLVFFEGTDTISAIDYVEEYYGANSDKDLIGCSVPATEHSVMCMGGKEDEIETFRRLLQMYPEGILSIVSDTWDFWKVITEYSAELRDEILNRQPNGLGLAKTVFRPDSGDPVKILTGYTVFEQPGTKAMDWQIQAAAIAGGFEVYTYNGKYFEVETGKELFEAEVKGAVQCLYEIFGGTKTETGHILLNERVGLIYGDSITLERCEQICQRLADKGFASGNVVFGIGSFTYQYNTRDTIGGAMKATYGVVNGEGREIFKDPATDSGTKKSAKGLLMVEEQIQATGDTRMVLKDQVSWSEIRSGANRMQTVFLDGVLTADQRFATIRERARS